MLGLKSVAFVYLLFAIGDATFPYSQTKCSIKIENGCFKLYFQNMIKKGVSKGFPDLNLPPLDPLELDNITVIIAPLTVTLKGINGVQSCVLNDFQINIEKFIIKQDITCDLTLQARVQEYDLQNIISIEEDFQLGLDKLNFQFVAPIIVIKNNAGDIYLKLDDKNVKDAKVSAENVRIGNEDITKVGINFLDNNFNWILKNFGKTFIDEGVKIYFGLANKFFSALPMKYYVLEDVSSYVGN